MSVNMWNREVSKWVEINDAWTDVTWSTREPIKDKSIRISTAANGYIISESDYDRNLGALYVETSLYGVRERLEQLLEQELNFTRPFNPDEYEREKLIAVGYTFETV